MSTLITDLYEPLRHLLPKETTYEDTALLAGVRAMIGMGKLPDYALTPDRLEITPALTDPNDYALLLYHTALSFVQSKPSQYSWRTRALSETVGSYATFVRQLDQHLYELEHGTMFESWTSLHTFLAGIDGLVPAAILRGATTVPSGTAVLSETGLTLSLIHI